MSKDGAVGSSGSLARDVDEPLDPAASITLETVVCRGSKTRAPIVIERSVEDGLPHEYRVTARIGDGVVAQERRALRVGSSVDGG